MNTNGWHPMDTAPKDREILVRRHNGVSHEHYVVWWSGDFPTYPWMAEHTSYPADRLDDWHEIPGNAPPRIETGANRMSKLAHSNQETMDQIERDNEDRRDEPPIGLRYGAMCTKCDCWCDFRCRTEEEAAGRWNTRSIPAR